MSIEVKNICGTSEMLEIFFSEMELSNIKYCILHSYEDIPFDVTSDIDIAVDIHDIHSLEAVLGKTAQQSGWKLIQKLVHEQTAFYYVFAAQIDNRTYFVKLDFCSDYRRNGFTYIKASALLKNTKRHKNFYIPSPEIEATYILLKKILKGNIELCHMNRIKKLYKQDPETPIDFLDKFFNNTDSRNIIKMIDTSKHEELNKMLPYLRKKLFFKSLSNNLSYLFIYLIKDIKRIIYRIFNHTGLFVCILGPDGAGKTSVANRVLCSTKGGFRKSIHLHWRPGLLPQMRNIFSQKKQSVPDEVIKSPHNQTPYNTFISFVRFIYYTLDFIVGYWFKILPAKIRSSVVIIERYFYDFLVDSRRYRLNLPSCIIELFLTFMPKPDIVIYLHNSPENLLSRKNEISLLELRRQTNYLQSKVLFLQNSYNVNTNTKIDNVAATINTLIFNKMEQKLGISSERYCGNLTPREDVSRLIQPEMDYVFVPNKMAPKILIPLRTRAIVSSSFALYNPTKKFPRLKKSLAILIAKLGLVRLLFKDNVPVSHNKDAHFYSYITETLREKDISIALSLGTPGYYRKKTLQIMSKKGKIIAYAKVAGTNQAKALLKRECDTLKKLKSLDIKSAGYPEILHQGTWHNNSILIQSTTVSGNFKDDSSLISKKNIVFLIELFEKSCHTKPFNANAYNEYINQNIEILKDRLSRIWIERLLRGLSELNRSLSGVKMPFGLSHGDFAPWSIRIDANKLFVFDWEYSRNVTIPYWDIFHYFIQGELLIRSAKPANILKKLLAREGYIRNSITPYTVKFNLDEEIIPELILCYLIEISLRNFKSLSEPPDNKELGVIESRGWMIDYLTGILLSKVRKDS